MKIKLIDFGLKADHHPFRPHENDAGADVFMPYDCILKPGEIARIPLGFGLIIPDGFAGYVFPRSRVEVLLVALGLFSPAVHTGRFLKKLRKGL